jgi:kumamolisin
VGGFGGASGGGASAVFPVPSYQSSAGITQITDSACNTTTNMRCIPDVAGMVAYGGSSASATADFFYINGATYSFIGTSCSCPLFAGLAAVLRSALGVSLGFLNPTLYQLGNTAINDITVGNNDPSDGSNAPFYNAGPGWDACTGWGSIDGAKLLSALQNIVRSGSTSLTAAGAKVAAAMTSTGT